MQKELLRTDELLPLLGVSRSTLYLWAKRGEIPRPFKGKWHAPSILDSIKRRMRIDPGFTLPDPDPDPEPRKNPNPSEIVRRQAPRIVPLRRGM